MDRRSLAIVVAGGGTGGHLYPGIAVARELLRRMPGAQVTFAGTARGLEARVVPKEGFELDLIRSAGLKGKSLVSRLRGAALLPMGLVDATRIILAAEAGRGDWRRRLQLGTGRAPRGARRHSDDGARAERGAGADEPRAGAMGPRRGGDV